MWHLPGPVSRSGSLVRQVFRNPDLRRVECAFIGFNVSEWGTWIAILVFAYRAGGATTAGVVGLIQLAPAVLVAPAAASFGDRYPRNRVLLWGYIIQAISMAATAAALLAGVPQFVVYAFATAAATSVTLTRPIQGALLPSLSHTTEELVAANVVAGWIESASLFAGPLLTGIVLAIFSPGMVFALMAAVLVFSALAVRNLQAAPSRDDEAKRQEGVVSELLGGFRSLIEDSHPRLVVCIMGAHFVVIGALDLLLVVLGIRLLDIGNSGAAYLSSAWGIGGLLGAAATLILVARQRLAPTLFAGAMAWGIALAVIGIAPNRVVAFAMMLLAGAGRPVIDVAGRTLLQRVVAERVLSRVFGVVEGMAMGAQGIGLVLAPLLFATVGDRGAFLGAGLILPISVLFAWRALSSIDGAKVPLDRIALLKSVPLFAPLPAPILERIAGQLIPAEFGPGAVIIRQGDVGDRFYVLASGQVEVTINQLPIRTLGAHGSFGEIALLRAIPRTATCTALTDVQLYALERDVFLEAVTNHAASTEVANTATAAQLPVEDLVQKV